MNNRLSALFEEDLEMQDALEDINGLVDDSEDIMITSLEGRYAEKEESAHLFESKPVETDEDDLTDDEEIAVNTALLDDDIEDDIEDAELDDDLIDAAIGDDDYDFDD